MPDVVWHNGPDPLEPDMPQTLTNTVRSVMADGTVDEALRRAFGPLVAEPIPPRIRAALEALRLTGSRHARFHPDCQRPF